MTGFRFFLIILIFVTVGVAWLALGGTIEWRTYDRTESLSAEAEAKWGPSGLVQAAPYVGAGGADPDRSEIKVQFNHNSRYMGLIWFSTYTVDFSGTYALPARTSGESPERLVFELPGNAHAIENLGLAVDSQALDVATVKNGNKLTVSVPSDGKPHTVIVSYRTQGRDRWIYDLAHEREPAPPATSRGRHAGEDLPAAGQTALVKQFDLTAVTNFADIDYPKGCVSPTPNPAAPVAGGMKAEWHFENRSTRERIGVEMPAVPEAGAVAARMSYLAPVSLFFFFTVLVTIVILKKIPLHPMHYLLISAGFFAFHILMAYLVDKIDIEYAFWICAGVSVFLVVSYIRLVAGAKFALLYVGLAQLVYLIGFSYAFFWKGWTGLTVVIVAIITLFVLMQATGRLDWNAVFRKPAVAPPAPPAPPKS